MDEKALHKLIIGGENEIVDFKRELKLETADEKAEFIKDLISLANSATDKGYLIIGVDNKSDSIGIDRLEEERIQQIAHAFIYPNLVLRCHPIYLDSKLIGVIEVQPTEKPHQIIKNIGRLMMHDVFIRHGSIVEKASPSEITRMREKEPAIQREIRQLTQAAEKHLKIGNVDQAIKAYTKAIDLMPTVELLLARARTYKYFFTAAETYFNGYIGSETGEPAAKDFSDALMLADSDEIERQIRLERLELFSMSGGVVGDNLWNQEFSWALENTQDEDYGQIMFFAARRIHIDTDKGSLKDVIDYLNIALKLGFEDPKVYYIRAWAYFCHHNFGLVMEDINIAVNMIKNEPQMLYSCLSLRALTLQKIGNFKEAYSDLKEIMMLEKTGINDFNYWFSGSTGFRILREEIYQRVAFDWIRESTKRNSGNANMSYIIKFIITLLILNESLPKYMVGRDGKPHEFSRGNDLEREMPETARILREIIGDDMWLAAKKGKKHFPKISFDDEN